MMNKNALIYFIYADFEEARLKLEKVHQMYNKFLSISDIDPTLVAIKVEKKNALNIYQFFF